MGFDATSTTQDVLTDIDLYGKTALITGASGGLGAQTALALASAGSDVILVSRDKEKTQAQAKTIQAAAPQISVYSYILDLASLQSVHTGAKAIAAKHPCIDILINNAGIMACPFEHTEDGIERQLGVNFVGHFLLNHLLMPCLSAAQQARVVMLSSGGHKYGGIDFDDPQFKTREYDKWLSYGASKTAMSLFAVALNKRLKALGGTANAVHPGVIYTDLGRHLTDEDIQFLMQASSDAEKKEGADKHAGRGALTMKSIEQGAATSVWAATHPSLNGKGGLYLEDCQIGELVEAGVQSHGYYPYVLDKNAAEKLWALGEQLVGGARA